MPPKRHIVRHGNAGNSAKASKPKESPESSTTGQPERKTLFPAGSKTPLALLNERCQKNGWERPIVEPRRAGGAYTCIITLRRMDKKTSTTESARMEPHPPLSKETAEEAKHWGAVYALYRFANNLQLNVVLPHEPRKYWAELAEEHKKAPEHLAWQYMPDPFAARKMVDERQSKARARREEEEAQGDSEFDGNIVESRGQPSKPRATKEFQYAPEVRMAQSLRESVEAAIKTAVQSFPELQDTGVETASQTNFDGGTLSKQLATLGFNQHAVKRVLSLLSRPPPYDPYLASLKALSDLDAALTHLLMTTNESDLPKAFLDQKGKGTTGGFVSSLHSGNSSEDLQTRWTRERATKEAGWPERSVQECLSVSTDWGVLMEMLGRKLVGLEIPQDVATQIAESDPEIDLEERDTLRNEEIEALLSVHPEASMKDQTLAIPIPESSLTLHIIYSPHHPYPFPGSTVPYRVPPMYITSPKSPPYVRLHILSGLLSSLYTPSGDGDSLNGILETGQGIAFASVDFASSLWIEMQQRGPPDVSEVMKYLLPPPDVKSSTPALALSSTPQTPEPTGARSRERKSAGDERTDERVIADFETMRSKPEYSKFLEQRQKLPAWGSQDNIIKVIEKHRVTIVVGETGCGKTTQLPQFILDHLITSRRGKQASILVTQPRRVSALGVSARVGAERLNDGSVGYAIRGDSKATAKTKLMFVTTGVALRRLATDEDRTLSNVTHVIIDEVHERSVDSDFLLLELRELLKRNKTIKVILMSATINQKTFVDYFGGAPVIEIPGFTHPVKDLYLEDLLPVISYRPASVKATEKKLTEQQEAARQVYRDKGMDEEAIIAMEHISRANRVDYQLLAACISRVVDQATDPKAAVLVFMPGVQEITAAIDAIKSLPNMKGALEVFPLHANLTVDQQKLVFQPCRGRKVVVATNVAETSITIPDVVYVIDAGRVKEISYDTTTAMSKLTETWVTKAAARQRRGRAGRTQPGECYKLYTKKQEEAMIDFPVPEILRVPLDALSLQVKAAREDEDVTLFLSKAIDPPKVAAMKEAWRTLENLGAIEENGRLTALGRHMSLLPLDLRLAKMLILGAVFRCLDPVLTVAASLSSKPLFFSPNDKRDEAKKARQRFATGNSDLLTDVKAYDKCQSLRSSGRSEQQKFCDANFISPNTVREITSLRSDFHSALAGIGFVPIDSSPLDPSLNVHSSNENLVKSVVCGGLWPRVAMVSTPKQLFDKVQAGTVEREREAKEYKLFEKGERVFIHPQSVMFDGLGSHKSPFFSYFSKNMTSKVFLRDVTEVPMYGALLFGGKVTVNHIAGGLTVGSDGAWIKLKAWPRIGVLVNQLRRLLDAQLAWSLDDATICGVSDGNLVIDAMLSLLDRDGLSM
ncbi:hypothetical protein M407DRAFT_236196 [Tulasnella calospora MUT 4182]|uniref:RNA helicase n=1 Tax=Tulasnella calospora MUT 4182 TaxID=1051891 RepID=A0A0C3KX04_9AGAM|nr:hypothetical protein M407DRAFT_236196 [Tulasnella calospora MUT 4182]